MLLDFQCYVVKVNKTKILIWYEQTDKMNITEDLSIKFFIIDISRLETITDPEEIAKKLNQNNKIGLIGSPIAELTLKTTLNFGIHKLDIPEDFKCLGEILLLAKSNAIGQESNYWDKMSLSLFILDCKKETVEIIPQDWFNKGSFDFMYQWPTRLKREETSNKIYGDGIRIRAFKLAENKREVEEWYL